MSDKELQIIAELMTYQEKKAEIENIELMILEVERDSDMTRAIQYCEKVQTSCSNNFTTPSEIIENLEKQMDFLKRKIKKVDNAISILDDIEKKAIHMRYIKRLSLSHLEVNFERSNRQIKRILRKSLSKIHNFM